MEGVNLRQNGIDGGLNPGGGGGSAEGAVSYMVNQYLNDTEKNRARNNIGAARASGEEPDLVAGDIMPKSNTPQVITNQFAAQTTGGDADLKSGSAQLLNIKGSLDANLNPFLADSLVSTGMNLVNPEQTLVIGGRKAYYFPVVRGNWGSYGTTNENNGFIIIGGDIYEVYFNATKPTAQSYGSVCPKTTYDGQNYYLPSSTGWMTIVCNNNTVPACHIAWSNYNDTVAGTFGNTVKNILIAVQSIHAWGMASLFGGGRSAFDELDFESGKAYERVDRVLLSALSWVMTTVESQQEGEEPKTTYIFNAAVSGMAANGLWACAYVGIAVENTTITITSETITSVEDLVSSFVASDLFFFEKATVVSKNIANAAQLLANTVNDFGLSYFMYNGDLVTVPAFVTEAFYQAGKDPLFNAVTYQKTLSEVLAAAVCELDNRLAVLEDSFTNGFDHLKVTNLEVTRQLTQPE